MLEAINSWLAEHAWPVIAGSLLEVVVVVAIVITIFYIWGASSKKHRPVLLAVTLWVAIGYLVVVPFDVFGLFGSETIKTATESEMYDPSITTTTDSVATLVTSATDVALDAFLWLLRAIVILGIGYLLARVSWKADFFNDDRTPVAGQATKPAITPPHWFGLVSLAGIFLPAIFLPFAAQLIYGVIVLSMTIALWSVNDRKVIDALNYAVADDSWKKYLFGIFILIPFFVCGWSVLTFLTNYPQYWLVIPTLAISWLVGGIVQIKGILEVAMLKFFGKPNGKVLTNGINFSPLPWWLPIVSAELIRRENLELEDGKTPEAPTKAEAIASDEDGTDKKITAIAGLRMSLEFKIRANINEKPKNYINMSDKDRSDLSGFINRLASGLLVDIINSHIVEEMMEWARGVDLIFDEDYANELHRKYPSPTRGQIEEHYAKKDKDGKPIFDDQNQPVIDEWELFKYDLNRLMWNQCGAGLDSIQIMDRNLPAEVERDIAALASAKMQSDTKAILGGARGREISMMLHKVAIGIGLIKEGGQLTPKQIIDLWDWVIRLEEAQRSNIRFRSSGGTNIKDAAGMLAASGD